MRCTFRQADGPMSVAAAQDCRTSGFMPFRFLIYFLCAKLTVWLLGSGMKTQ